MGQISTPDRIGLLITKPLRPSQGNFLKYRGDGFERLKTQNLQFVADNDQQNENMLVLKEPTER